MKCKYKMSKSTSCFYLFSIQLHSAGCSSETHCASCFLRFSSDREMKQEYQDLVLQACGASSLRVGAKIQTLWSGYGEIVRLHLEGCDRPSVVVKHVKFPEEAEHPGGGNTDRSHTRKVRSYQVETHWYQNYSTSQSCRIPACLAACSHGDEMLIVLEDLDAVGYDQRR